MTTRIVVILVIAIASVIGMVIMGKAMDGKEASPPDGQK
jgi:cytochrome c biogenesis protein ResB